MSVLNAIKEKLLRAGTQRHSAEDAGCRIFRESTLHPALCTLRAVKKPAGSHSGLADGFRR